MIDYLKVYNSILANNNPNSEFYLKTMGNDAKGYCFLCDRGSLSIEISSGKGKCWGCDTSMNVTSFITKYHETWLEATPDDYYQELVESRGIPMEVLKQAKLAYDCNNDRWLMPHKNLNTQFLANLGHFYDHPTMKGERKAFDVWMLPNSGDMFPKPFYNPNSFHTQPTFDHQTLIICEGQWDTLAMIAMCREAYANKSRIPAILGVCGASHIPKNAMSFLKNYREVYLVYDNDKPGEDGAMKMAGLLSSENFTVKKLNWSKLDFPSPCPEGYDIRDLFVKRKKIFGFVSKACEEIIVDKITPENEPDKLGPGYISTVDIIDPVDSLTDYFNLYEKYMVLSDTNRDSMIAGMAIAAGTMLPGEPLWAFLVGVASDGKTTFIESFGGNHEWCDYSSKLTSKALVSGLGEGASNIPKMNNKCYFIKDFTVILGMPKDQQRELFDILRDVYDGSVKIPYGNGKVLNFQNLNFNLIAGVTPAIYRLNEAQLGERFLRINYSDSSTTDEDTMTGILRGFGNTNKKKDDLTKASVGYLKTIRANFYDNTSIPQLATSDYHLIGNLANYIAQTRTKPEHNRTEGLIYRPQPEASKRLGLQFVKLSLAVQRTLNATANIPNEVKLDDRAMHIISKVAYDTCEGFTQDVLKTIYFNPKVTQQELSKRLSIPSTRTNRVLEDLKIVGLVTTILRHGGTGRPSLLYKLKPAMETVCSKMFGEREDD